VSALIARKGDDGWILMAICATALPYDAVARR